MDNELDQAFSLAYEELRRLAASKLSRERAGQTVPHLHMHLLGGRDLKWPPG